MLLVAARAKASILRRWVGKVIDTKINPATKTILPCRKRSYTKEHWSATAWWWRCRGRAKLSISLQKSSRLGLLKMETRRTFKLKKCSSVIKQTHFKSNLSLKIQRKVNKEMLIWSKKWKKKARKHFLDMSTTFIMLGYQDEMTDGYLKRMWDKMRRNVSV